MIEPDAQVVRITSTDQTGNDVVQYALPQDARKYGRMSFEQYGNVSYESIAFDELPDDIRDAFMRATQSSPES